MKLAKGGVTPLAPGAVISVDRGLLWLTQYPDRNDHLLAAGQTLRLDRRGAALASALRESDFAVVPAETDGRRWLRFLASLAARRAPVPV